jgi:CheY-like chemotaxis protein
VTGQRLTCHESSQGTILCVEDNKAYLWLRKAVLEREGYSVLAASTGAEALQLFREVHVSLSFFPTTCCVEVLAWLSPND